MLLIKTLVGVLIFVGGIYLVIQESTPYQYSVLPNLLCAAGLFIAADGFVLAFRKLRSMLT